MKRIVLVLCVLVAASTIAQAQTADDAIATATLAAPPALGASAMVIRLADDGGH